MKIVIIKLSSLGDIVHTMVALQFIKKACPNSTIDWIVEEKFKGILENNPHIDNIYTTSFHKVKKEKSITLLFKELSKKRKLKGYDYAIDAQGLLKSSLIIKMISAKKKIGFDKGSIREPIASIFYNEKISIAYEENSIVRNIKLLCGSLKINVQNNQIIEKKPFLISSIKTTPQLDNYILFVIGSTWSSRNYPKEKFVEIANILQRKCIVLWGNEEEKRKAEWMSFQSNFINMSSEVSINELKDLINNSNLVIGNDTGPTHMAWGMNKPSITLFGPTPINRVYQTKINRVIKSSSIVNHFALDKNDFSIKEIKVKEVVKIALQILER